MSDSQELRNPMGQPRRSASEAPTRSFQLSRQEAKSWLFCVNQWLQSGSKTPELEALRGALEDACWLARWKREEPTVELCPSLLPGMLEALVQIHSEEPSSETSEHLETIIRRLSA